MNPESPVYRSHVIEVIEVITKTGCGITYCQQPEHSHLNCRLTDCKWIPHRHEAIRELVQYWSLEGDLLAERDQHPYPPEVGPHGGTT